jgi:hypothetical protein
MSLAQRKLLTLPYGEERRRFQRVKVDLLGRYMLSNREEYPCQVINMSPGGVAMYARGIGAVGERVVAYLDHIGRIEGKIARILDNGFAMTVAATPRKRDRLAAQLTWLANRDILSLPEDRRHDRLVPRNPMAKITLADGSSAVARIVDLSLSGAALSSSVRPEIGSAVTVGVVPARVVRHTEDGFAIEFTRPQHPDTLEDSVTGE